jgi:hypothetical protein
MAHFEETQLEELAQVFGNLSAEVGQVRLDLISAGAGLADPKIVDLLNSQLGLLDLSSRLSVEAAQVELTDADAAANAIGTATKAADAALNKLADIDKAVSIGSAAVLLGTAIFSGNMDQIAAAGKTLLQASTAPAGG